MSRLATRPRIGRLLAASVLVLVGACGETDSSGPTSAPSGPTTAPSDTSKPAPVSTQVNYIYLADADGTVRGRLMEGTWPSWSPDGRRLAFTRNGRVRVIDADGSNEKDLAAGEWPAWSPDGLLIAYVPYLAGITLDRKIQVMSPDGSGTRTLLAPTVNMYDICYNVGALAWAPDGATIAFVTGNCEFPYKIALVSADGTGERRLTAPTLGSGVTDEWAPAWSPDGSRIVYGHSDFFTGDGGLSIIDRSGEESRPLAGLDARPTSRLAWSPDGQAIIFSSADGSLMIVPSSGGSPSRVIFDGTQAAWSPDGKRIAFVRRVER